MKFCPLCFKFLLMDQSSEGNRLLCRQCRYYFPLLKQQKKKFTFHQEDQIEIVEQNQQTKELPKTKANCDKCGHGQAYYEERQTRSADEAATLFFTCAKCGNKWNEN